MHQRILLLFAVIVLLPVLTFADIMRTSTVDVSEFIPGVSKITYDSTFFGYQSGINRDFTIYGRAFGDQVDIPFSAYEAVASDSVEGITAEICRVLTGGLTELAKWPGSATGGLVIEQDFNADGRLDLALYKGSTVPNGFHFMFDLGKDFTYAENQDEYENFVDPYSARYEWTSDATMALAGNFDEDGTPDLALVDYTEKMVHIRKAKSEGVTQPPYDYSVHLMKDGDLYRMWYGCRYIRLDREGNKVPGGDGDHVCSAYSRDGRHWIRRSDGPVLLKGEEEGYRGVWWSKNYLEPEVIKLGNLYYMFMQVMIVKGDNLDVPGVFAERAADRMQLCLSPDGEKFTRYTERSVVINVDNPSNVKLTHHETLYVPDSPQPFWFYVFYFEDGKPKGHVRMTSKDPFTFDWHQKQRVSGMAQIGNQLAYADLDDGNRIFFRITHSASEEGKRVPSFQVSSDGLKWSPPNALLAGCEKDLGCFFLGLSTIDGTGKLDRMPDGSFHALYGATTSKSAVVPAIFYSEIGVGEVTIRVDEH